MRARWIGLALVSALAQGCGKPPADAVSATPAATVAPPTVMPVAESPASGLGELMGLAQMRHSKLWFAGEAGNWKLAAYELSEMQEGFADVVRYHPTHKQSPVPIDEAVKTIMAEPLSDLGKAIAKADRKVFESAYDTVTDGCNACHQATDFGYIVVQRPKANPYSNQVFAPEP